MALVLAFLVPAAPALADGTTWTPRAATADIQWWSVAYGDGLWVAVAQSGSGNRVMTSTDGIQWTSRTSAADHEWRSVAFGKDGAGNDLWVAVASSGSGANTATNRVMTSPDGINWTVRATPGAGHTWFSVAFGKDGAGNGLWVAVASGGNSNDLVMTSPDGTTWTAVTSPPGPVPVSGWYSVAFGKDGAGDDLWVAVGEPWNFGQPNIMTSPDGSSWTASTVPLGDPIPLLSVAYGDGRWVAVGFGDQALTSTDGTTWVVASAPENNWRSVAYGDGLWVAVSWEFTTGGAQVMTSPDGITWTPRNATSTNDWQSVAFGDGLWVAVAKSGSAPRVMTSGAMRPRTSTSGPSLAVSCEALPPTVGATITCTVSGGEPGVEILWRAAHRSAFGEAGVTLGADGTGTFTFVVPAAALGQELTVELVEWARPVSLGVVGGPVPGSVPAGDGPVPAAAWMLVLAGLAGVGLLRRGMRAEV